MVQTLLKRILLAIMIVAACATGVQAETVDTRIGKLEFTHTFTEGYPTDATVNQLFDEMDFQRAVQSYYWAIQWAILGLFTQNFGKYHHAGDKYHA